MLMTSPLGRYSVQLPSRSGVSSFRRRMLPNAPRAELIEVARLDAVLDQVLPGRAVDRDGPGRRDVVGGDRVAQQRQDARAVDVAGLGWLEPEVVEVRRLLDV